jgi:hypothetical protein
MLHILKQYILNISFCATIIFCYNISTDNRILNQKPEIYMELNFETSVFDKEKIQMGSAYEYIVKGGRDNLTG